MANVILIKRGQANNIGNMTLQEGELALAFNEDKSKVELYAGGANGKVLINPDLTGDIASALGEANSYTDLKINDLVNGAPEAMDTLKELADAISENSDIMTALQSAIGNKVDKISGMGLSENSYTTDEKNKLAGISAGANKYTHPSTHMASMITTTDSQQFVSSSEKTTWNSKLSSTSTIDGGTF